MQSFPLVTQTHNQLAAAAIDAAREIRGGVHQDCGAVRFGKSTHLL